MKSERKILIAFILNFAFSIYEFIGGVFTGSIAIISDAIHDIGDAASIGISYFLEKKSRKQPDEKYTYGYIRYSVIGGAITSLILVFGSFVVIFNAVCRIMEPTQINYDGMIVFAIIGVCVNFCAALFTHGGVSLNQRAVNLHMLEDVLGWVIVLIGAVVMRFTDFVLIDPIMSLGVAIFILVNAIKNLKEILDLFLEKVPGDIDINKIKEHLSGIDGVLELHHIHIRSIDGQNNHATMHIVTDSDFSDIKKKVREELREHGITHATLELETPDEHCHEKNCCVNNETDKCTHHHHHHHH